MTITANILKTILGQQTDTTPIWLMRQAGRYLPEYRALRAKAGSFLNLCKTPSLACNATLQPLKRFNLDAAIIFSDILTIPDALGLGLEFHENHGPYFNKTISNSRQVNNLPEISPEDDLAYVLTAITYSKQELQPGIPLIGFCGSPWTLACYMIEGRSKTNFATARQAMQRQEPWLTELLKKLAKIVARHLQAQINAGADIVMIFDTWGSILSLQEYQQYSLPYIQFINKQLKQQQNTPIILYIRGNLERLLLLKTADPLTNCDVISVDQEIDLRTARAHLGSNFKLQGNLAPHVLLEKPQIIRQEVAKILAAYGHGPGHIFNLSHGITPNIPPEHVAILVDAVHELSAQYHISPSIL
jgi:uroporphyrinogen decarboxylase